MSVSARVVAAVLLLPALPVLATPASAAVPDVSCAYRFAAWDGGFVADLTITNHGPAIDGWTAHWTFRTATGNLGAWQARMTQPDPFSVTATNMAYNAVIDTGRSVRFGWTASAAATETPSDLTVNGVAC
ncbi:cellulose binding domain-containing protein [Dactylosporangium sp. NPDC005555]|uniref:cellulose binding domain-containing protein n=1 Tax=Dactylosporangium sp. NPDC005555 TaxID=3154889 RepID=UPI0033B2C82B